MIRYIGILDGANLAPASIREESHVLVFTSLAHAQEAARAAASGDRSATLANLRTLAGDYPGDLPGGAGDGLTLTLWRAPSNTRGRARQHWQLIALKPDPHPDYLVTIGALGGARVERA